MTGFGSSIRSPQAASDATTGGGHSRSPRVYALMESLMHSVDLASRGYLCAPLVDCDPMTDPECGTSGENRQMGEIKSGDH